MKKHIFANLLIVLIVTTANASYEKGVAAYNKRNYSKAMLEFLPLAESGNAEAQTYLGLIHQDGDLGDYDFEQAVYWFEAAAKQGNIIAQFSLGKIYAEDSRRRDDKTAIYFLSKAAEQGHAEAQFMLAMIYYKGRPYIHSDSVLAANWFLKAANQGYTDAKELYLEAIKKAEKEEKSKIERKKKDTADKAAEKARWKQEFERNTKNPMWKKCASIIEKTIAPKNNLKLETMPYSFGRGTYLSSGEIGNKNLFECKQVAKFVSFRGGSDTYYDIELHAQILSNKYIGDIEYTINKLRYNYRGLLIDARCRFDSVPGYDNC